MTCFVLFTCPVLLSGSPPLYSSPLGCIPKLQPSAEDGAHLTNLGRNKPESNCMSLDLNHGPLEYCVIEHTAAPLGALPTELVRQNYGGTIVWILSDVWVRGKSYQNWIFCKAGIFHFALQFGNVLLIKILSYCERAVNNVYDLKAHKWTNVLY